MRWGGLIDRNFLIASLCGAGFAHAATKIVLLANPRLPYWGIAPTIYACLMVGGWLFLRRAEAEGALIGAEFAKTRDSVLAMSLIEAAREARRRLADDDLFQRTPATVESPPILDGVPESIRALLENAEQIERIDDDFLISRRSLAMLPDRRLQIGRWTSREGSEWSIQVNLATGEASLWLHGEDDEVEEETLPSVYHLIVLESS